MNIAILYGGKTGEHEVSMVSASSVARNIDAKKHNINLISITKEGLWYLQPASELEKVQKDAKAILSDKPTEKQIVVIPGAGTKSGLCVISNDKTEALPTDVVFPVLHGTYGEDGLVQGLLEMAELPYCGCDVMSSAISMDKEKTKQRKFSSVAYELAEKIQERTQQEVRVTIPGHMQRGGTPCPYDRVISTRFGAAAADFILKQEFGCMVAIRNDKIVKVPLEEVAGKLKTVDPDSQIVKEAKSMGISFGN